MLKKIIDKFLFLRKRSKLHNLLGNKIDGIDLNRISCDMAAKFVWKNAEYVEIPYKRLLIKTKEEGKYLGHINLKNQSTHEVVKIGDVVYDLYYPKRDNLKNYLKKAYSPNEGVNLIVEELN